MTAHRIKTLLHLLYIIVYLLLPTRIAAGTHQTQVIDIRISVSSSRKLRVSLITGSMYVLCRKTTAVGNLKLKLKLIPYRHGRIIYLRGMCIGNAKCIEWFIRLR